MVTEWLGPNKIWITFEPYKDTEYPYVIHMPYIEIYAKTKRTAFNYCKDKRRIKGQRRREAKRGPF